MSQIENGLARPSVGTLWALVSELGISMDGLFQTPDAPAAPPDSVEVIVQLVGSTATS